MTAIQTAPTIRVSRPIPAPYLNNKAIWNGVVHGQDNLRTHAVAGTWYQYLAFWATNGSVIDPYITRRALPNGSWSAPVNLRTASSGGIGSLASDADSHETLNIAIDGDNVIHVMGNMHSDPLRYVKSNGPDPNTASWSTVASMVVSTDEDNVAYPMLVNRRDGALLCFYQNSAPGDTSGREMFLNRYDVNTDSWVRMHKLIDGITLVGGEKYRMYPQHIVVSDTGLIHLFWCWRLGFDAAGNHDLMHMRSGDGGLTWTEADGDALVLPIKHDTVMSKIYDMTDPTTAVPFDNGMTNNGGACVDVVGRPHSIIKKYRSPPTNTSVRAYHVYFDGTQWVKNELPAWTANIASRFKLVAATDGRVYAFFTVHNGAKRGSLQAVELTPGIVDYNNFPILDLDLIDSEPTMDTRALSQFNEWHLLATPAVFDSTDAEYFDATLWERQWGAVVSFDLEYMADLSRGSYPRPRIDTIGSVSGPSYGELRVVQTGTPGLVGLTALPVTLRLRDDQLFVRMTVRARTTGGTLTVSAYETPHGGVSTAAGSLNFTETSDALKTTPWLPLRTVGVATAEGFVEIGASVNTGQMGTIVDAVLDLGVLIHAPEEE